MSRILEDSITQLYKDQKLIEELQQDIQRADRNYRDLIEVLAEKEDRITELKRALAPFANFGRPEIWEKTAWRDAEEDHDVMYCHATGDSIKLGDFYDARSILDAGQD